MDGQNAGGRSSETNRGCERTSVLGTVEAVRICNHHQIPRYEFDKYIDSGSSGNVVAICGLNDLNLF